MADNLSDVVEPPESERLATGFGFTEGPLWHPDGYLLFRGHTPEPDTQAGARRRA